MGDLTLASAPSSLACAECGASIEVGYLPADEAADGYEPRPDAALCDACGFTAVGLNGCAPRLSDLDVDADALLLVEADGGTVTATSAVG